MVVAMIPLPMCKVEAITPIKFNAEFPSDYCSHDASTTPNYWQRAIGRTTSPLILKTEGWLTGATATYVGDYRESIKSAKTRAA